MEEIKLESWQRLTVESLAGERERLAKRIGGINAALKHYTEEWAEEEGSFEFDQRPDGLYLVTKDETELAPAD
jgi:hypothetical protein